MSPRQVVMAWLEEMQAMVTVWAGMRSENPAPRAASRAMLEVFTSCRCQIYMSQDPMIQDVGRLT